MNSKELLITKCEIGPFPRPIPDGMFDKMPSVSVTLSNGESLSLFDYYPDEISFDESEFIGLTIAEAKSLKTQKDLIFIRS
jgi:hypothetical protein